MSLRTNRYAFLALVATLGAVLTLVGCRPGTPAYTGRTTLMAMVPLPSASGGHTSLADQVRIATGQKVMMEAAETMRDLGSGCSPEQLKSATRIEPEQGTSILSIEVTLEDPVEAKKAADVIASSFRNTYSEMCIVPLRSDREIAEKDFGKAKKQLASACAAAEKARKRHAPAVDLATADADIQAAKADYVMMKRRLAEARTALERAKVKGFVRTIDPACVFMAR